jgi:hypothetical protein
MDSWHASRVDTWHSSRVDTRHATGVDTRHATELLLLLHVEHLLLELRLLGVHEGRPLQDLRRAFGLALECGSANRLQTANHLNPYKYMQDIELIGM